jgi:hypothetical protein
LKWAIEGSLDWQRNGLVRPEVVSGATSTYFETQDMVGNWLDECCEIDARRSETLKRLFESFSAFADANGANPGKAASLSDELSAAISASEIPMAFAAAAFSACRSTRALYEDITNRPVASRASLASPRPGV